MISNLSSLTKKTEELEREIELLKNSSNQTEQTTNCVCINKNFSNLEIILSKKILLSNLTILKGSNLFFQGQINLFSNINESVEVSLLVNNILVQKNISELILGNNQISIFCNFTPIASENLSIYLRITPKNQKIVYLQTASIFVWGSLNVPEDTTYQALELNDNYLISFLSNQSIYYKIITKDENEYNFNDFTFLDYATNYSFAYSKTNDKIYVFRINENGDLFYSTIGSSDTYLFSKITSVSAICLDSKILVCIITNGECKYFEIDEYGNVSMLRKINGAGFNLKKVYCYYNGYSKKVYMVLTDIYNSNYLIEQASESLCSISNLQIDYDIFITISEVL